MNRMDSRDRVKFVNIDTLSEVHLVPTVDTLTRLRPDNPLFICVIAVQNQRDRWIIAQWCDEIQAKAQPPGTIQQYAVQISETDKISSN